MSLFCCLGCTKVSVQVRGLLYVCFVTWYVFMVRSCQHLAQPPSWKITPCRLSATAYSIYSQLPSILEAVPPSATWGRAMLWWQGPTYHGFLSHDMVCFTGPPSLIHDHHCNIIQHSCNWLCHEVIYKQSIRITPLAQKVNCSWHKCDAEETNIHLSQWPSICKVMGGHLSTRSSAEYNEQLILAPKG